MATKKAKPADYSYLNFYIGNDCLVMGQRSKRFSDPYTLEPEYIKDFPEQIYLILRPISQMTKREGSQFAILCGYSKERKISGRMLALIWADPHIDSHTYDMTKAANLIRWLCGKGFDVFGLIKAKKAFDKKKAKQLIAEQKKEKPKNAKVPVRKLPARNRRHL